MTRFICRRLLETIPLLFLISVLVFLLFELIPGDYLSEMELNPAVSRETIKGLRRDYGLDRPFYVQYFLWLAEVLQGNLGYSFAQQRPAANLILERLGNTLILALSVLFLTLAVALPVGVLAALRPGSWVDRGVLFLSLLGLSLPSVLAGLFFLLVAFQTGLLPLGGKRGLSSIILPCLTLASPAIAFFVRSIRLEMIEALRQPFVIAAAARGLRPHRVVFHALRSAVNPVISLSGLLIGTLLSGAAVAEKIFNWPGLGALMVDSILSRDLFVVLSCVIVSALMIIAANLLSDILLALNDPRIRYQ